MEEVLIDAWLGPGERLQTLDEASVSLARDTVRRLGHEHALPSDLVDRFVLVVSELATNQLKHARAGALRLSVIARDGVRGLEVVAADRGPGIVDPTRALEGSPRATGSLGVGLAAVSSLSDEVDFDVRVGEGLCVAARKFEDDVRRRREIGVYGRPIAGERESGDAACFHRDEGGLVVGVCDGLGHGALAREASVAAMRTFHASEAKRPVDVLEDVHLALAKTRGGVMAVARIDERLGSVEVASVGNITALLCGPRAGRRFGGSSFVLGAPQKGRRVLGEHATIAARELFVMFTDGVRSLITLEEDLALQRERPVIVAHQIAQRFGREGDDALVLVAR